MEDQTTLYKLCWLIAQVWKAELAYNRAQYRVSYYRKLKAKLEKSKKASEKWNDHIDLVKKIESERLNALKKQEQLLKTKKRFQGPISVARNKLNAKLQYDDGKIVSMWTDDDFYKADEMAEMADQHEADKALTKILKGNNKS
jgi:hypothetical protein